MEYFLAVAEHESIGGAAAALGVAQPSVSQSLRRLERELGTALFHRLGRGMMLSAAGRAMLGPARQMVRDTAAARDQLAPHSGTLTGRLDILAFPAIASGVIVELLSAFRRGNPQVAIHFGTLHDERDAVGMLRDGHCEFVAAHLPLEPGGPGGDGEAIAVLPLGRQEYWLAYPPGTELPEGPVPLAGLPDIPMVFAPRGTSVADEFAATIRQGGTRPRVAVLTEHRAQWSALVFAGVGGTLLEHSLVQYARGRAVLRRTDPPLERGFGLAYRPDALSPAGAAFVALATASAEAQADASGAPACSPDPAPNSPDSA